MSDWAGFWIGAGLAAFGFFIASAVEYASDAWERINETEADK